MLPDPGCARWLSFLGLGCVIRGSRSRPDQGQARPGPEQILKCQRTKLRNLTFLQIVQLCEMHFFYSRNRKEGVEGKRKASFDRHSGERPSQKINLVDEDDQEIIESSQTSMEDVKPTTSSQAPHTTLRGAEKISNKASSAEHHGHFEKELVKSRKKKPKLQSRPISTNYNGNGSSEAANGNHCVNPLSTHNLDMQSDCLSSSFPCACAQETGGEFAYTPQGLLKEEFLTACLSMKDEPQDHHYVYCQECPLEKAKNEYMPEKCKGHLVRKFIKECWTKCGCDMSCGNRIVQRGLRCKLQVFLTREGKGWGLRTLENLPKGTFVCEYVGEILTNTELYERNVQNRGSDRHTYPVTLDADWGSEGALKDEEALCLDATYNGNVARCYDANLIDIPVEVETPDHHYYHVAFFTNRKVNAYEELTWDYGIDFDDHDHPIEAFRCCCGSAFCGDKKQKG
ncbi:SET domain [Sesbania bispinosa]|nr:SET domain [Sesbania bispinosa]